MHQKPKGASALKTLLFVASVLAAMLVSVGGIATPASATGPACGDVILGASSWMTANGGGVDVHANPNGTASYGANPCAGDTEVHDLSTANNHVPQWGLGWECVELMNRLYLTKGWIANQMILTDGAAKNTYSDAAAGKFSGLAAKANGSGYFPVPGDIVVITSGGGGYGHVSIVNAVGATTLDTVEQNSSSTGRSYTYNSATGQISGNSDTIAGYVHATANNGTNSFSDGDFLSSSNGHVYEVVGGAPLLLWSWSDVGGSKSTTSVQQSVIDAMPQRPADGTFVTGYGSGTVYEILGGAPVLVYDWSHLGGSKPVTTVANNMITGQLLTRPADGTYIADYMTSQVYVTAGGALLRIDAWSNVGGQHPITFADHSALTSSAFPTYPADGTYVADYGTQQVYVIVGGAAEHIVNWSDVGGEHPITFIDDWAYQNQFRTYPTDGSYLADYGTQQVYVVAGGALLRIDAWSNVGGQKPITFIPHSAATSQFLSYPSSGTYVRGYQSGAEFLSNGTSVTRVTTTPLPAATSVDDWAIVNQLGGTL